MSGSVAEGRRHEQSRVRGNEQKKVEGDCELKTESTYKLHTLSSPDDDVTTVKIENFDITFGNQ